MSERLLNPKEAGVILRIGYDAVLKLIHEGVLPTVDLPGRRSYRIDPVDVQKLIEASKSGSIRGSEDEMENPKTTENVAPLTKSRGGKVRMINGPKEQWMQPHLRKMRRG